MSQLVEVQYCKYCEDSCLKVFNVCKRWWRDDSKQGKIRELSPANFLLPDESKDLQVPSGLSMPSFINCTEVFGLSSRLTPPTKAASQWPWRMLWKAFSKASKLEEQAVSMAVLGPREEEGGLELETTYAEKDIEEYMRAFKI